MVCGVAFVSWLGGSAGDNLVKRVPGPNIKEPIFPLKKARVKKVNNPGTLIPGAGRASDENGSWPQFRGEERTNIARSKRKLARSWPDSGLKRAWEIDVGMGHAGVAIHKGRVYFTDYDKEGQEDAIRCLSLNDGKEIWRFTYSIRVKQNHGMSRTVSAVNDNYIVSLGPKCHVFCLDAKTGKKKWSMDLVGQFGAEVPPWYAGQCPLIVGDKVILAPGGNPLMMAVSLETGDISWKTKNPGGWGMTHSSIVLMNFNGKRQFVYCATLGVLGVSAETGEILWTHKDWRIMQANVPTPVIVGKDRIFLSGGYNNGCVMLRLENDNGRMRPRELFRKNYKIFGSDQQTPILYGNYIYGIIPGGRPACMNLEGKRLWVSDSATRFGLGPYIIIDDRLLMLKDQACVLVMAEAVPDGYRMLAETKVLDGHDAWAPMAYADGKLILRDLTRLVCLEIPEADK